MAKQCKEPLVIIKTPAIIVDMEGTLSDCAHRGYKATGKEWHEAFIYDPVNPIVKNFILNSPDAWGIFSGKPIEYMPLYARWLEKHMYIKPPLFTFMRAKGDGRSSRILKEEWLDRLSTYIVTVALDNREDICLMYKSLGIETFKVMEGR